MYAVIFDSGVVKVGFTANLPKRIHELSKGAGCDVRRAFSIPVDSRVDSYNLEGEAIEMLKPFRLKRQWRRRRWRSEYFKAAAIPELPKVKRELQRMYRGWLKVREGNYA